MAKIKISIIVTFYNLEDYAKRCIASLTSQTLQDIEIICVNDGSQDHTIDILQEFAQNDDRIKIIDKKNEGVSIARNTGINVAIGEYIMFVDGDDYLELNACEILYQRAMETDADIISFQRNLRIKDKIHKDKSFYPSKDIKNTPYFLSDKMVEIFKSIKFFCWDKLYRKNFVNNIKFPEDFNYGEDSIFLFYCLEKNPKILIIENYIYNYTVSRKNSLTTGMCTNKKYRYSTFQKIVKCISYINNNLSENKLLQLLSIDRFLALLVACCGSLYLSETKKEYISFIAQIFNDIYQDYDKKIIKDLKGYKLSKLYLFLDKYYLLWFYILLYRPICEYLIVKPYRFLKINFKK